MSWFLSVLLIIIIALCPAMASAWPPNGVGVTSTTADPARPQITSDGAGGVFVAWQDYRNYGDGTRTPPNLGIEFYLQHVTGAGLVAAGWPLDGLLVGTGPGHQFPAALHPDGSGGLLIVYGDTRFDFGDLYLQRITAAGAVSPGWPAAGVPVGVGPREQFAAQLAGDGEGGVFVSWQDSDGAGDSRARYTHVLASGELAPGWPANGRLFEPASFLVSRPLILGSAGGFLAAWAVSDNPNSSMVHVRAQRFLADGTADPAWPPAGLVICPSLPSSRGPVARLVRDGADGFYTIFEDYRDSPPGSPFAEEDLYAQHVLGSGAIAPGWPADALPVSALAGTPEGDASLCEDGQGGMFVVWVDYRSNFARVFGQHLLGDGQRHPGWPALGLSLTDRPGFQIRPRLAWDGARGAYVSWMNLETGGYRSYVQHLTAGGTAAPGWPANGLPVIPLATDQYEPGITADGRGGAIVAWEDIRGAGIRDLYAQRFVDDGVVAAEVSLASAEATPTEVRVRWQVSGERRAQVERREGEGAWQARAPVDADGLGYMSHVDRDVTPGGRYGYRLAFASGVRGGETVVDVPVALSLTLEGARPNPAVGALWVAFTLPEAGGARLALYDLAGRQVAAREVGARGAGRHRVRLDDGALSPGLYWAALTQGARTLRTRVAVVR